MLRSVQSKRSDLSKDLFLQVMVDIPQLYIIDRLAVQVQVTVIKLRGPEA